MPKLLLVEDDPQVRAMLEETLSQEGFQVSLAENGAQALKRYREDPADVVVMDIIMPVKDGVETTHALKKEFPDAKIIAISGGSANLEGERLLKTAEALGADKTFTKPLDLEALAKAAHGLVGS